MQLVRNENIERHLRDLVRDHHRHEDQPEQPLAALEADLRERIARHGREYDVARHRCRGDDEAVDDPADGVFAERKECLVRIERPHAWEDAPGSARRGNGGAERRHDHIEDREKRQKREEDEDHRKEDVARDALFGVVYVGGVKSCRSHAVPPFSIRRPCP